jgi:hypothetical protein
VAARVHDAEPTAQSSAQRRLSCGKALVRLTGTCLLERGWRVRSNTLELPHGGDSGEPCVKLQARSSSGVEMLGGCIRLALSVAAPFVWRCPSTPAVAPFTFCSSSRTGTFPALSSRTKPPAFSLDPPCLKLVGGISPRQGGPNRARRSICSWAARACRASDRDQTAAEWARPERRRLALKASSQLRPEGDAEHAESRYETAIRARQDVVSPARDAQC